MAACMRAIAVATTLIALLTPFASAYPVVDVAVGSGIMHYGSEETGCYAEARLDRQGAGPATASFRFTPVVPLGTRQGDFCLPGGIVEFNANRLGHNDWYVQEERDGCSYTGNIYPREGTPRLYLEIDCAGTVTVFGGGFGFAAEAARALPDHHGLNTLSAWLNRFD